MKTLFVLLCVGVLLLPWSLVAQSAATTMVNNCAYGVDLYYHAPYCKGGWNLWHLNPGDTVTAHQVYTTWGCNTQFEDQITWSGNNTGDPIYYAGTGTNAAGTCGSLAPPATTNCSTLIVKNVDPIPRWFLVYTNGNPWVFEPVGAGQTKSWQYCVTNGGLVIVTADRMAVGSSDSSDGTFTGTASTNGVPSPTGTNVGGTPDGGIQYGGSTSNINWGTTTPNVGDSALLDAITKIGAQAHDDANKINTAIGVNNNVSVTNVVNNNITLTNSTDLSGVSNLLAEIKFNETNAQPALSLSNSFAGKVNGAATNWAAGESIMQGVIASTSLGSDIESMKTKFDPPDLTSGGATDMTLAFCGRTIDLDITHIVPGAQLVSYWGIMMIAYLYFGMSMGRLFGNTVNTFASTQLGGVPDMAILGTNGWGLVVALVVPFVFVTGFTVAVHGTFLLLLNYYLDPAVVPFPSFASVGLQYKAALQSGGGHGWYLLTSFVPVHTCISLLCTRIVMQFAIGAIIYLAVGTSRFLFGK